MTNAVSTVPPGRRLLSGMPFARRRRARSHGHRHPPGAAAVSIRVRDLAQLLNSLDPAPFWDRDLDRNAAAFIEDEFTDRQSATAWHLNVTTQAGADLAPDLQTAVETYYGRMASAAQRELVEHRRMGRLALLVGLGVFFLSITVRELLLRSMPEVSRAIDEGLIVLGWIALWRPTEMLAYEWIPLVRKRRLFERLAGMRVAVRTEVAA